MKTNLNFFKKSKSLSVDDFFQNVLYDNKFGYYNLKHPFGGKGDFITAPNISNLFCEMIAIWIISTWENLGKPKKLNIVELGPGDGSLIKILLKVFQKFPEFDSSKQIYLFEISKFLKKIQKKNIKSSKIKWIQNFNQIDKGPIIFFGNEFFDAIPIKQFKKKGKNFFEKFYYLDKNFKIKENYKRALNTDIKYIKSFSSLKNLKFIEFPKLGFKELNKIIKKIKKNNGCILLIDYGYLKARNKSTLQSIYKHKKNHIFNNLTKADITAHVNFALLKEFFLKNNLKVKNIITQKDFLSSLGINERAEIISKKMKFSDQSNLYFRLKRLMEPSQMGSLFKVILAYKFNNNNFYGFK